MTVFQQLETRLNDALHLRSTPVAVVFRDAPADDAPPPADAVAAGCRFWEAGQDHPISTTAADHRFCSIGIHTHNLADAPGTQMKELTDTLELMQGLDYVSPAEVEGLPVLRERPRTVDYRPLGSCRDAPACVLLFLDAAQSLVVTEAVARVDGESPPALGRPACAVVPFVANGDRSAVSLGCCGARAYLDRFDDATSLWALSGDRLADYVEAIETFGKANEMLTAFHQRRRDEIARQETPSVMDTFRGLQS